ncbi:MAG TPA: hypothetical protein VG713_04665 [Pirellulales bacterium]|nr:hypothetical protein [Pirellulales bacterium]
MSDWTCIICDRNGDWSVAWRVELERDAGPAGSQPVEVVGVRTVTEAVRRLADNPHAVVAIEIDAIEIDSTRALAAIDELDELRRRFPHAPLVVIAVGPGSDQLELALRQCGAWQVLRSRYELRLLVRAIRQHFRVVDRPSAAEVDRPLRAQILDRLPWSDATPQLG